MSTKFKVGLSLYLLILVACAVVAFMGLLSAVGLGWSLAVVGGVAVLFVVAFFAGRGGTKESVGESEVDTL